jgi:hypothetical protein
MTADAEVRPCCATGTVRCSSCHRAAERPHASFGAMDRFIVPAAASIVVGLLLGAAAVFGVTLMVQEDSKPPLQAGDPTSSVLNRVEYGDRS